MPKDPQDTPLTGADISHIVHDPAQAGYYWLFLRDRPLAVLYSTHAGGKVQTVLTLPTLRQIADEM